MITLYGIKTCDTCRKARAWMTEHGIAHRFHDLRADGIPPKSLGAWVKALGWEALLNRRSTTWRALPEREREDLDAGKAAVLMAKHPTLIKRPIIEADGRLLLGFTEETRKALGTRR